MDAAAASKCVDVAAAAEIHATSRLGLKASWPATAGRFADTEVDAAEVEIEFDRLQLKFEGRTADRLNHDFQMPKTY